MSRIRCEHEAEVLDAVRQSKTDAGLDLHVATCDACTETRRVAGWMLQHAAVIHAAPLQPPAASRIWHRAQAQKQELVLLRAARAVAILRVACVLYAAVFATWCMRLLWHTQESSINPVLAALASRSVYVGAAITITTGALGAGFLLLLGKRDGSLIAMN